MYVYLVDDEPLVLASLKATLAGHYETLAFESAEALLDMIEELPPGVALIDMSLPGMDGSALQKSILDRDVPVVVVFLTGRGTVPAAVEAIQQGAVDFLSKPIRRMDLLSVLGRATKSLSELLQARDHIDAILRLTIREREVLQSLATGAPSKLIAHELGISARTVEMHRAHICEKMGVPTTAAIAIGCETGLIRASATRAPRGYGRTDQTRPT